MQFIQKLCRSKAFLSLVIIVAIGGFFRAFEYADWMHYELDQARDFKVISAAIEKGPGELPLQGPKAAGNVYIDSDGDGEAEDKTTLRLGPLFYYLEYASALVFGDTPAGSVMLVLLLSIATIPLFYFFLREFFPQKLSLLLTLVLACSLYFIIYSRFGWNPNLIPFFTLLCAYALLRVSREDALAGRWLVMCGISYAFLSNMHFLALVVFPIIGGLYLLIIRPRVALKYWIGAVAVVVFLNIPLVINDIKTGGENYKAFVASLRGESGDDVPLSVRFKKNVFAHAEMSWVVLTGDQDIRVPRVSKQGDISCDDRCMNTSLKTLSALLFMLAGLGSWLWLYRHESDAQKRRFLLLAGLWLGVTFCVYLPLAFDLAPRFFLVQGALFVVFLGFISQVFQRRGGRRGMMFVWVLIGLAMVMNIVAIKGYFDGMRSSFSDSQYVIGHSDLILGEKTRVPKQLMENVVDAIMEQYALNGEPIHLEAQAEYKRAFWERVAVREDYTYEGVGDLRTLYRKGNYFVVVRTQSDFDNYFEKFAPDFDIVATKNFGTLTLYTLAIKESVKDLQEIDEIATFDTRTSPQFSSSAQVRYLWRQVFEGCTYNYESRKCEK